MIRIKWYIGNDDLVDAYTIRSKVFINEQNIAENLEFDNKDGEAHHIVIYDDDRPVATGRLINENNQFTIGRIAVLKEERRNGYGNLVVKNLIRKASSLGGDKVIVHAQMRAAEFYKSIGFKKSSSEYIEKETGIEHIDMVANIDVLSSCM